jgi:hypothetical protein
MVAVIMAARGKCITIGCVSIAIEKVSVLLVARHAFASQIGDVTRHRA